MVDRRQYIQQVEHRLEAWDEKIDHVRRKAQRKGQSDSEWLEHAMDRRRELDRLLGELRAGDESTFEERKAEIAIATEELETAMVRTAERFQEAGELGLKPASAASPPPQAQGYSTFGGEVRSGSGVERLPSTPEASMIHANEKEAPGAKDAPGDRRRKPPQGP